MNNIITNNINYFFQNFNLENFFNGKYEIINQSSFIKDKIINAINEAIIKDKINFSNIINGENNLLLNYDNIIFEITSSNNKNKSKIYQH